MYNGIVEESQNQRPRTPEDTLEEMRQEALVNFKKVIESRPSRQMLRKFLNGQAMSYLGQTSLLTLTRKQRRIAARAVSSRLAKKVIAGEEIFDAGV